MRHARMIVAALAAATLGFGAQAADKLKVGFVYVGADR